MRRALQGVTAAAVISLAAAAVPAFADQSVNNILFWKLATVPANSVPTALTAGQRVWVTVRGRNSQAAGMAYGFDSVVGQLRDRLRVGSVPVAAVASGGELWVANGTVPGYRRTRGKGTVELFSDNHAAPTKQLRVPFHGAESLIASPAGQFLVASANDIGSRAQVRSLTRGARASVPLSIADETTGAGPPAAFCGGTLYIAGTDAAGKVQVASLTPALRQLRLRRFDVSGVSSIACAVANGRQLPLLIVSSTAGGGIRCLKPSRACSRRLFGGAHLTAAVSAGGVLVGLDPAAYGRRAGLERIKIASGKLLSVTPVPRVGPAEITSSPRGIILLNDGVLFTVAVR